MSLRKLLHRIPENEENIIKLLGDDKPLLVTYINPFVFYQLNGDLAIFEHFDMITSDGIIMSGLAFVTRGKKLTRLSPDLSSYFAPLFARLNDSKESIYLVGSSRTNIENAVQNLKSQYPNLNFVGIKDGYFSKTEENQIMEEIIELKPTFVIVGMGTPLQEQFLLKLRSKGWNGKGVTCGGFIHQTAEKVNYYPRWINDLQLRWVYRIYREPKLFKRYILYYPISLLLFAKLFFKELVLGRNS